MTKNDVDNSLLDCSIKLESSFCPAHFLRTRLQDSSFLFFFCTRNSGLCLEAARARIGGPWETVVRRNAIFYYVRRILSYVRVIRHTGNTLCLLHAVYYDGCMHCVVLYCTFIFVDIWELVYSCVLLHLAYKYSSMLTVYCI